MQTNMRREIDEIPEAAARLLDHSSEALEAGRRSAARQGPGFPRDDRARFFRPCRAVPEICDRAAGRSPGRLARSVAGIDLWRQAEARWRCRNRHFAIGQEPGYRRDGAGCDRCRCGIDRAHQYAAVADLERLHPSARYSRRPWKSPLLQPSPIVNSIVAGLAVLGEWTGDAALQRGGLRIFRTNFPRRSSSTGRPLLTISARRNRSMCSAAARRWRSRARRR